MKVLQTMMTIFDLTYQQLEELANNNVLNFPAIYHTTDSDSNGQNWFISNSNKCFVTLRGSSSNYNELSDKPQIENQTLVSGNNTADSLNLQNKLEYDSTPTFDSTKSLTSGSVATALNTKQNTITGAASTIATANLNISRVVITDNNGKIITSGITPAVLNFLTGCQSNVQEQFNVIQTYLQNKVDKSVTSSKGTSLNFNESDGGGNEFQSTHLGTIQFSGVNDGENGICAQMYAKNATTNVGTRLNLTIDKLYYTKGKSSSTDYDAGDEVMTFKAMAEMLMSSVYFVGCVYKSTINQDPSTILGMGTWQSIAAQVIDDITIYQWVRIS